MEIVMKKISLIWLIFLWCAVLSWCFDIMDWPWMEMAYPEAEQECVDNEWEVTTDFEWNSICIFYEDERCYLDDLESWKCEWLHQWWGEWITLVTQICEEEWWRIEEWNEWWDKQDVCFYLDGSFCYLEDLAAERCHKWDVYYSDDNLYPYAEQACIDSNWQVSKTEEWVDICILSDDEFCYMDDIADWGCDLLKYSVQDVYDEHEDERAYQEYIAECYNQPQITVCGQDWNSYYNKCFMEKAGVEEETELAEVVDGECIYG